VTDERHDRIGADARAPGRPGHQPEVYEIRVKGHLDGLWTEWFDGLTLAHDENGVTTLTGPVVDQAALYGLLDRMRDLGLTLLSVHRMESRWIH
jgi:hypothetical protein